MSVLLALENESESAVPSFVLSSMAHVGGVMRNVPNSSTALPDISNLLSPNLIHER